MNELEELKKRVQELENEVSTQRGWRTRKYEETDIKILVLFTLVFLLSIAILVKG